jgi:hypothetical protein
MSTPPLSSPLIACNHSRDFKFQLPPDFSPSPYSVLIGRGKSCTEATGNKRLKVIVSTFLNEYSNAGSRIEKSIIVGKIVDIVREACPLGAFIKQENGNWWEVSDHMARERVGSMLRDSLHEQYRSSSKSKLTRRRSSKSSSESIAVGGAASQKNTPPPEPLKTPSSTRPTIFSSRSEGSDRVCVAHDATGSHQSSDDDALTRIDAADVLLRRLPRDVVLGHTIIPGKADRSIQRANLSGVTNDIDTSNHYSPTVAASTFPPSDDFFKVLAQHQQVLNFQMHQNEKRQEQGQPPPQQHMYHRHHHHHHHQQQQQQRLLDSHRRSYDYAMQYPRDSAVVLGSSPEFTLMPTAICRPSRDCQNAAFDPTSAVPNGSLEAAMFCMAKSMADTSNDVDDDVLAASGSEYDPKTSHNYA